ncbi:acyltransferase [Novosphingobium sp. BL-8H]|uniref:acyltransferase family protein n=1 Tax=Novosphingobium sp. BL-8H TaxID=3127640 RepID=UPI003756CB2A
MGTLRLILAIVVLIQHIGRFPFGGDNAVVGFFVISGYLMTFVMQRAYGYTPEGFSRFWCNRALRLYPSYLLVIAFSVGLLALIPDGFRAAFKPEMAIPASPAQWLANLTMVYPAIIPSTVSPRMAPATWAITCELAFYLLISLGLSRSRRATLAWLGLSLAYSVLTIFSGDSGALAYLAIPGGSLPFCIGALLYHYRDEIGVRIAGRGPQLACLALGAITLVIAVRIAARILWGPSVVDAIALILTGPIMLLAIAPLAVGNWTPVPLGIDKRLGDLSYPIYISHWIVGLVIAWMLDWQGEHLWQRLSLCALTLPISMAFGLLSAATIDPQIEHLRARIRAHGNNGRTPDTPAEAQHPGSNTDAEPFAG